MIINNDMQVAQRGNFKLVLTMVVHGTACDRFNFVNS